MSAAPLADTARQELRATGARPRRAAYTGIDALTPSERRVAQLAADGLTTPQIAQALFVTPKTIQTHLDPHLPQARHHLPTPAARHTPRTIPKLTASHPPCRSQPATPPGQRDRAQFPWTARCLAVRSANLQERASGKLCRRWLMVSRVAGLRTGF